MKRIYISGQITGLGHIDASQRFLAAEEYLHLKYQAKVVNPMKASPYVEGKTWEEYMLSDIALLFECDTIFMLDNWEQSKGARIELSIAENLSKNIIFEKNTSAYKAQK